MYYVPRTRLPLQFLFSYSLRYIMHGKYGGILASKMLRGPDDILLLLLRDDCLIISKHIDKVYSNITINELN